LAYTLVIPVCLAVGRLARGQAKRWSTVVGIVCLIAIVMTFSRSAIIVLPVAGLAIAAASGRLSRGAGVIVVTTLVFSLGIGLVGSAGAQVGSSFDTNDKRTSAHVSALQAAPARLLKNPLGSGLGTAGALSIRFATTGERYTENAYVYLSTEVGTLGVLFLITFVAAVLRQLWRAGKVRGPGLIAPALAIVISIALGGLVLNTFSHLGETWMAFLIVGLALPSRDRLAEEERAMAAAA
jgi:hypothetical protein